MKAKAAVVEGGSVSVGSLVDRLATKYEAVGGVPIDEYVEETVRWWLNAIATELRHEYTVGRKASTTAKHNYDAGRWLIEQAAGEQPVDGDVVGQARAWRAVCALIRELEAESDVGRTGQDRVLSAIRELHRARESALETLAARTRAAQGGVTKDLAGLARSAFMEGWAEGHSRQSDRAGQDASDWDASSTRQFLEEISHTPQPEDG